MIVPNYNVLEISYVPQTRTRGERIRIKNPRFKESIIITYKYEDSTWEEQAYNYLMEKGFIIEGRGQNTNGVTLFSSVFNSIK